MQKRLEVGQIVNTFGIKGEVKVTPFTDDIADFNIDSSLSSNPYSAITVRFSCSSSLHRIHGTKGRRS